MIVICSPDAANSQWVNKEIIDFKRIHGEDKVLAMIVEGEPNAVNEKDEAFPKTLKYRVNQQGYLTEERIEPLAADAREIGEGKERAKIKLIAGLLGVGFNDLWRREKRRQKKYRIILSTILTLLFIIISTLSVFSFVQWKESEHQKKIAIEGREAAENLIEHTLFDLRDKLEPIGKLELLAGTFDAVDEYYNKLGTSNVSSDVHFRIVAYHANNGSYFKNIGDLSKSKNHFIMALSMMEKLVSKTPLDTLLQRNCAVIHSEVGTIMEIMGQDKKAREHIQIAHSIFKKQSLQNPLNKQLKFELAKSYGKLGSIQRRYEKSERVIHNFHLSLRMMKDLLLKDSNNTQWQNDKATTHILYGTYCTFINKYEEAYEQFKISLKIRKKLVEYHPDNYLYKHRLSESYKYIGTIYLKYLKDIKKAQKSFEIAQNIIYELVQHDPKNIQWQNSLARIYYAIGDLHLHRGEKYDALKDYTRSIEILYKLIIEDTDNFRMMLEFSLESSKLGNIYFENNNTEMAKMHLERALNIAQILVKDDVHNFRYRYLLSLIYYDLATLYQKQFGEIDINNFYSNIEHIQQVNKEFKKGERFFKKSFKILEKIKQEDPQNPLWRLSGDSILQVRDICNTR